MTYAIVTRDLFFTSKIESAARKAGKTLRNCGSVSQVIETASELPLATILLDLTCDELKADVVDAVARIRQAGFEGHIVAYGPHIDESGLKQAQAAGCDLVLSRGQFHSQLGTFFD